MPSHKYIKPAHSTLSCLGLKKNEKLLIITDHNKLSIAWALFDAAQEIGAKVQLVRIPVAATHGSEPPDPLPEYMKMFDAIIAPTSKSISHTDARRNATKAKVRIATMPDIFEETFLRAMEADYGEIARRSRNLAKRIGQANTIKVKSPLGTDINLDKGNREVKVDSGQAQRPGDFTNLPAGEVYFAPIEGSGNGIIAVDGSMAGIGLTEEPLVITIENGYAVNFDGYKANELEKIIEPHGPEAKNLAELGIGTNDRARLCGSPLEDEKVMGTVHLALGDNQSMGGKVAVPSHLDGIIKKPSLWLDDEIFMKDGHLLE
jgi:leucyl aminopeptidase (aminopeptidase T)